MSNISKGRGFTLMEVMIVVAVVGILASIALPSYQEYVIKGNRRAAQSDLMAFAQAMEKEYAVKFTYANAVAGTTFPDRSPQSGSAVLYNLSIPVLTASTYTVRATPTSGRQSGDGVLEITHLGQKFWDRNDDADTTDTGEDSWE